MNNKKTTSRIASLASRVLTSSQSSETAKKLAGSTLSQVSKQKESSTLLDHLAAEVLKSQKYNEVTKELAGSVLSQAKKK
jgi:hypothetical protein